MEPLSDEWVSALSQAAKGATDDQVSDRSGQVEVKIGKKDKVTVALEAGRFVGPATEGSEVDLTLPFASADELAEYLSGRESMAKAYIRGDFKPVGSTGVLLSVIELVESGALSDLG